MITITQQKFRSIYNSDCLVGRNVSGDVFIYIVQTAILIEKLKILTTMFVFLFQPN